MSSDSKHNASTSDPRPWVIVALGANLGNAVATLVAAADALASQAAGPVLRSPLYQTTPVDCPAGSPLFVNAVVAFHPRDGLTPELLLDAAQALERQAGRRPKVLVNEARPLDVDLIDWGGEVRDTPRLILPHPRAHLRRFVLAPLADLFPSYRLSGMDRTVTEVLKTLPEDPAFQSVGASPGPEKPWLVVRPQ